MLARRPLCVAAGPIAPGARVKVTAPVTVYHVPKSKGAATQLQGLQGLVTAHADKHTDGSMLSCTMPLKARARRGRGSEGAARRARSLTPATSPHPGGALGDPG